MSWGPVLLVSFSTGSSQEPRRKVSSVGSSIPRSPSLPTTTKLIVTKWKRGGIPHSVSLCFFPCSTISSYCTASQEAEWRLWRKSSHLIQAATISSVICPQRPFPEEEPLFTVDLCGFMSRRVKYAQSHRSKSPGWLKKGNGGKKGIYLSLCALWVW